MWDEPEDDINTSDGEGAGFTMNLPQTHFTFFHMHCDSTHFSETKYRWSTQTSNTRHCSRFALHLSNCDRNIRYCCCGHRKSQIHSLPSLIRQLVTCYPSFVIYHPLPASSSPSRIPNRLLRDESYTFDLCLTYVVTLSLATPGARANLHLRCYY